MLGKRQVAAPLMAQRAAHGALRPAHRRFQPGAGVGVQFGGLRPGREPQRCSQRKLGHETLVLGFALIAPAASRPCQHCAVRRQRGRQVAPCGHTSTVGQGFLQLVVRDDRGEWPEGAATAGGRIARRAADRHRLGWSAVRIFVAGATGVIGLRLVPLLLADGHTVAGMTRSAHKAGELRELGAEPPA
jgi:hypothetical protein